MKNILQFKITLNDSEPLVWRRFLVTDDYRLDRFHQVIQLVMGWENCHLHEFVINGQLFGMSDMEPDPPAEQVEETTVYLHKFALQPGDQLQYNYDFGDSWHHLLTLEEVRRDDIEFPECLDGEMACPPEDIGGVGIFNDLTASIDDPESPEDSFYAELIEDGYDPYLFDIKEINKELKKFGDWHKKHPNEKSTPWHQLE